MKYLIAGAGAAGVTAAEALRELDSEGSITLIGAEDEEPYSRMAIPYYLSGKIGEEGTRLRAKEEHYRERKIDFLRNRRVVKIDSGAKKVLLDGGEGLDYDRLLLATGSRPIIPPIAGIETEGIHQCWSLADARGIHQAAGPQSRAVLIGAGFIGTILLDALARSDVKLTVIELEERIAARMMNLTGSNIIKKWCINKGVDMRMSTRVESVEGAAGGKYSLTLEGGEQLEADFIITATGVAPIMDYLEGSGIETGRGILVNGQLQTSIPDIFAAGDVAEGRDFLLERPEIHAIQPTAAEQARICARNMAGTPTSYRGSLAMNMVETLGLIWYSFGAWQGLEGGEHGEQLDEEHNSYLRLEFKGNALAGAICVGGMEHMGIIRGMIQSRMELGKWKELLMREPRRIMEAYLELTERGGRPLDFPLADD